MNCLGWEERLALHAQGDLPPREAAAAEQHLLACAACRHFFESVQQSLGLLHEAHAEPLAPADYAALRARVLAELDRRRKPLWRWAWIPALAAALLLVLFWTGRHPPVPPPQLAVTPPPAPPISLPELPPAPKPVARVHRRKPSPPPAEPLLVRLVTDNPDVVIYWIAN